jgi:hypothetical protein
MKQEALHLFESGLSVIPIDDKKVPIGSWKKNMTELIQPNGNFANAYGVGIVCGAISGNIEVIDIDTKYDLTGTLFQDYKELIASVSKDLLRKLVVQRTVSGGYHFIYRCSQIENNQKLAQRPTSPEEKIDNPKDKVRVLIETRGQGGYIACVPTPNYEMVYGDLQNIQEITTEERIILIESAKYFNQIQEEPKPEPIKYESKDTPFDQWNDEGDVLSMLVLEGWKVTGGFGPKKLLLRPGGEGKWSADYDEQRRLFYVFTSSTEFEQGRAYNPSQVLTILKFNGDYGACGRWLRSQGYGAEMMPKNERKAPLTAIDVNDDNYDFVDQDADEYLESVRNGTFKEGLLTGIPGFDQYFRFKEKNFVVINGHDNVGKSTILWYFSLLSAMMHGWKWIIYSSENKTGGVKKKLMEFYHCKTLKSMTQDEFDEAKKFVENHYCLIRNDSEIYTYRDMLAMGEKLNKKVQYNAFLIDPYNSLYKDLTGSNEHKYDYDATSEMRLFIKKTGCSVYLNCHAITESLRAVYHKDHPYAGHPMPPKKADTEGGGKFSNRADDFITLHRLVQHDSEFMNTQIHVRKIKESETGGKPTKMDFPFILKMIIGGCGFETEQGYNPILILKNKQDETNQKYFTNRLLGEAARTSGDVFNDKLTTPSTEAPF